MILQLKIRLKKNDQLSSSFRNPQEKLSTSSNEIQKLTQSDNFLAYEIRDFGLKVHFLHNQGAWIHDMSISRKFSKLCY